VKLAGKLVFHTQGCQAVVLDGSHKVFLQLVVDKFEVFVRGKPTVPHEVPDFDLVEAV
jgi:hypothetical protein